MIFLFVFAALVVPLIGSRLSYVVIFFFSLYGSFFLLFLFNWKKRVSLFSLRQWAVFLLPLLVFFSWVYGFLLGLSKGVVFEYAISNFAGLAIYSLFYIFFFLVDLKTACRALFVASVFAAAFAFYSVFDRLYSGGSIGVFDDSISSARIVYSGVFLYVVPFVFMYLMSISPGEILKNGSDFGSKMLQGFKGFSVFLIFSFTLLVPALSKGFILVYGLVWFLFILVGGGYACITGRTNKTFVFCVFSLCIFVSGLLLLTNFFDLIVFSFSEKEVSNSVRSEQLSYLVDEWSFSGSGLGSALVSGYARDDTGYGFELTYVNLVNKLGVFALPLFLSYLIPVMFGVKKIFTKGERVIGGWVLGLMAYLVPGAANPLLLAPEFVIMHFIALATVIYGIGSHDSKKPFTLNGEVYD